jgi:mono/diheme cytochrome c family protein
MSVGEFFMNIRDRGRIWGVLALTLILTPAGAAPQTTRSSPQAQQVNYPLSGSDLYRGHCAPCHGSDAKGTGPVAPALKIKVPDLTALEKNNRGQFPLDRVRRTIMSDQLMASHGSRDMPVWGPIFAVYEKDLREPANIRIENILKYLQSIQQK